METRRRDASHGDDDRMVAVSLRRQNERHHDPGELWMERERMSPGLLAQHPGWHPVWTENERVGVARRAGNSPYRLGLAFKSALYAVASALFADEVPKDLISGWIISGVILKEKAFEMLRRSGGLYSSCRSLCALCWSEWLSG